MLTRYTPPELLMAGMNAGDSKTLRIKVNVYDLSDPKDVEHKGALDVTLTYVGAYRVTVPEGTFDAGLLKWNFKGKIGPAASRIFRRASSHLTSAWSPLLSATLLLA